MMMIRMMMLLLIKMKVVATVVRMMYCAVLSNRQLVAASAFTIEISIYAKTVGVLVYANIRDKNAYAKTVGVVAYASIRE